MMEGWKDIKLGNCLQLLNGYAFKSKYFTDNHDDLVLIKGSNLGKGQVLWNESKYWDKKDEDKFSKYILKENDVILAMDRPWVGGSLKFAYIKKGNPKSLLVQRIACLRSNTEMSQLFLKYVIASDSFSLYIKSIQGGVGVPHISPSQIKNYKLNLPPIPTQQKIATILSAYDDLIENNLKRIKLLEEQAQLTYEEWFVRLKFPGHESTPINPETGLPEGWQIKTLDYLCEKITDGTHDSPKQVESGFKLITGKHLNNGFINFDSAYLISTEDHEKIKKRSGLSKGDLLFSNIGTLGNIGLVTEDFEYSCKNVVIFKKKVGFQNFLYCYLSDPFTKKKLNNQSSGVAQKFYSLTFIRTFKDKFPDVELLTSFDKCIEPLIQIKFLLNKQNETLKEARDILLPRLMTGMIDVDKLDVN